MRLFAVQNSIDPQILLAIHRHASPFLDSFFVAITHGADAITIIAVSVGLVAWKLRAKQRQHAAFIIGGIVGAGVLNLVLKAIFERARPDLWSRLITESSYSFPSGHAMGASALACVIVALFWHARVRWYVVAGAVFYTGLIGFSRLYLGVHYPSDVLAGWLISAVWVVSVWYGVRWLASRVHKSN